MQISDFLIKKINNEYNEEICKKIKNGLVSKKPVTFRINTLKTDKEKVIKELKESNIEFEEVKWNNDAIIIKNALEEDIRKLKIYENGEIYLQSLSSMIPPVILEPKEKENILDMAAAPGGKTTYIAELMENEGQIDAWDLYETRTKLIKENAERLGITIINTKQNDATKYQKENEKKYDKILLDVPCMGIGVIKRKPDIKWHREEKDLKIISKIQKQILENCSKYLKEKGTIVYSTSFVFLLLIFSILQEHKQMPTKITVNAKTILHFAIKKAPQ